MLFNSLVFIFLFLPVSLLGYCALSATRFRFAFLSLMSMAFYAFGSWTFAVLLAVSTAFNLAAAKLVEHLRIKSDERTMGLIVFASLSCNLLFLCYFKYLSFLIGNVNALAGAHFVAPGVALPIGISFYTFLFMATIIDVARGDIPQVRSSVFVSFSLFFPHLLAGPLVHYQELGPQMERRPFLSRIPAHILIGLVIFTIGLFKKTVLADTIALYVKPIFSAAQVGAPSSVTACWLGALSFTLQIYFDFSGYSDMAIGLARMFGFKLPLNFHSPLRAPDIIEFWRRWHMTLQRFIVAYLFPAIAIPLTRWALSRRLGKWPEFAASVAAPTLITFIVVGFWHGANWTFVIFGALHGLYITACQAWRKVRLSKKWRKTRVGFGERFTGHTLLLIGVACANVVFRSETPQGAWNFFEGMVGAGTNAPLAVGPPALGQAANAVVVFLGFIFVLLFPNTQQIMHRYSPSLDWAKWRKEAQPVIAFEFRPTLVWAGAVAFTFVLAVAFIMRGQAEFIYFRF